MTKLHAIGVITGITFILILGCHSVPLISPGGDLEAELKWQREYTWARENQTTSAEKACAIFTSLAGEAKFPVHQLAELRRLETCPSDTMPAIDVNSFPDYAQDVLIDVLLKLSADKKDTAIEMQYSYEKSRQNLPQSEKVKLMTVALENARALADKDRIEEYSKRLYEIAPRLEPNPTESQYLLVAHDYRLARRFSKARDYYGRVIKSPQFDLDSKISAYKGIRQSYKNVRDDDKHISSSNRYLRFLSGQRKSNPRSNSLMRAEYEAAIYHARALWTLGQAEVALGIFKKLENRFMGKISLAELYWLMGRIADERENYNTVSKFMELAIKEKTSDIELRDKILWYSAWNERRQKNFPKAIEFLKEMEEKVEAEFTRARAIFWLARTYADNQQKDESKAAYSRIVETDPLGYYGLLAHRELDQPIKFHRKNHSAKFNDADVPLDSITAQWLAVLHEYDALNALLDQTSRAYKKQKDQTDEGWVFIFQQYAKAGLYMKLYASLGNLTPEQRKSIFENYPELLFPRPWAFEIKSAAKKFEIEAELLYSIIRQESAFNTYARSPADAFGLMQLLPEVATQLSKQYQIPYKGMEDLYDPATNINMGAAHLKDLFTRQKGQFILAVASYNASERAIQNWMKTRFRNDSLEFIEEIPYEETRSYVRLVMRNLIFYKLLDSDTAQVRFPDQVLNLEN